MNSEDVGQGDRRAARGGGAWGPRRPFDPAKAPFFYGWVIVAVATLGIIASVPGQTIGVGVFNTRLMEAMGLSAMALSTSYMIGTLASATLLGWGGRLFDRFGARKALVASVVVMGFVLLGLSASAELAAAVRSIPGVGPEARWPGFALLCVGFALLRFSGQGMVTLSARAMLGKWFDRRRGLTTALSGVFFSLAASLAPPTFEAIIRTLGWEGAWFAMAVVWIVALPPLFWLFARDNPEACGLEMDGGGAPETEANRNADLTFHRDFTRAEAARTFAFWAFALMMALNGLVMTAFSFHVLAVGEEMGVSGDYILNLFFPVACVSVVCNLLFGWLADRARLKYILALMGFGSALGYGALGWAQYPEFGWVHVFGLGVSGGCFGCLSALVWPRFYGREYLGEVSGLFMTLLVTSSAVGPFLFSWVEALAGGYRPGFGIAAGAAAILFVAAFKADNPQRKLASPSP